MPIDPETAHLRAQVAAHARWSRVPKADRTAATAAARAAQRTAYERQVDPDGTLPPDERSKLAANARAADMARLGLAAHKARAAAKAERKAAAKARKAGAA
jgi:uncharacterized protein YkwD